MRNSRQVIHAAFCAGVSVGMLSGDVRKVLNRIMSIAQDHYPETMGETIIVNAPVSFRFVWNLIRPMLQPRTVNKITLLGAKYYDELTKRVEPDAIPSYMGGNCQKTLLEDPGPWNDERVADLRDIDERPSDDGGGLDPEMGGVTPVAAHDLSSRIGGATPVAAHDFSSRMHGATPVAAHDSSSRMDGMPSASAALSKADSGDIKSLGGGRSSMEVRARCLLACVVAVLICCSSPVPALLVLTSVHLKCARADIPISKVHRA